MFLAKFSSAMKVILSFTFVVIGLVATLNAVQGGFLNYLFGGYTTSSEDGEKKDASVHFPKEETNHGIGNEVSNPSSVLSKPTASIITEANISTNDSFFLNGLKRTKEEQNADSILGIDDSKYNLLFLRSVRDFVLEQTITRADCSWNILSDADEVMRRKNIFQCFEHIETSRGRNVTTHAPHHNNFSYPIPLFHVDYNCGHPSSTSSKRFRRILQSKNISNIVMIGDSTIRQQFFVLLCILNFSHHSLTTLYKKTDLDEIEKIHHGSHSIRDESISAAYFPIGRAWGNSVADFEQTFANEIHRGNMSTLIIINHGIHHSTVENECTDQVCGKYSLAYMARVTSHLYNNARIERPSNYPRLIWRESTPQNFNSSNGHFKTEHLTLKHKCIPLSVSMKLGFGPLNNDSRCDPSCFPANSRNLITNPIFEESNITISRIYHTLSNSPYNIHHYNSTHDCSHLNIDAIIFTNNKLFDDIKTLL